MDRPELLERLRGMLRSFPPCEYLKGMVEVHRFVDSLSAVELEELRWALLVLLARPEDATPVALNLAQDLGMVQARHVLLSHLYSRDFFPRQTRDVVSSPWTDVQRGVLALTLARLGAQAAAPMLQQEVTRRLTPAAPSGAWIMRNILRRLVKRVPGPDVPPPVPITEVADDADGVTAATSRETRALLRALAIISPETAIEHTRATARMDLISDGHVSALLQGLRESVVPCVGADWVAQALQRLPRSHPARVHWPER